MALADGQWRKVADASTSCEGIDVDAALKAGQARMSEPVTRRDLLIGDQQLVLRPAAKGCGAESHDTYMVTRMAGVPIR